MSKDDDDKVKNLPKKIKIFPVPLTSSFSMDAIFSPRRFTNRISPTASVTSIYRTVVNDPLTSEIPKHGEIIKQKQDRLREAANAWFEHYFELASQSIQSCNHESTVPKTLNHLKLFLGPQLYELQMQYREAQIIRRYAKWKMTALFEFWSSMQFQIKKYLSTLEIKVRESTQSWFSSFFSFQDLHIFEGQDSRHKFLLQLVEEVAQIWSPKIRQDYEEKHINIIVLNLIHRGHDEQTIRELVKYPLSSQYSEYLDEIINDFFRWDGVKKFSNSGDIKALADDVAMRQAYYNTMNADFDVKADQNSLVDTLKDMISKYEINAKNLINADIVDQKANYCKNQSPEEFINALLSILQMTAEFREDDYIIPLATLCRPKGKSLIDIAIQRYCDIVKPTLKEAFFPIIELLYKYGATHELAFGRDEKNNRIYQDHRIPRVQLQWKILILEIKNIYVHNEFEAALKRILLEYSANIPDLFDSSWWKKIRYDWHGLKRSPERLYDVQELAYALFKSTHLFDDHKIYTKFMELQKRINPKFRVDSSELYDMIRKNVFKPTFYKIFSFFGELSADLRRGIFINASRYAVLQKEILDLRDQVKHLTKRNDELDKRNEELNKEYEALLEKFDSFIASDKTGDLSLKYLNLDEISTSIETSSLAETCSSSSSFGSSYESNSKFNNGKDKYSFENQSSLFLSSNLHRKPSFENISKLSKSNSTSTSNLS